MSNEEISLAIGAGQLLMAILLWLGWDMKALRGKWPSLQYAQLGRSKLILILLLGGLAFSSYGFYVSHHNYLEFRETSLETIYGGYFKNEVVELDGKRFDHAYFENVTFKFNGRGLYSFNECKIVGREIRITTDSQIVAGAFSLPKLLQQAFPGQSLTITQQDKQGNVIR